MEQERVGKSRKKEIINSEMERDWETELKEYELSQLSVDDTERESLIAYMARVSNPSGQTKEDNNNKLLKYLVRNKHWSPFEMVNVCMEITTTRDIARQILRHRSFSFQEFSQRYAVATEFDVREGRMQDNKNRQNPRKHCPKFFIKILKHVIDFSH